MITVLTWLAALVPAAMLLWFTSEILAGLPIGERPPGPAAGTPATFVVVVPAHNEAAEIAATLHRLCRNVDPDRVLVVADNCTDDTATLARRHGVRVAERHQPALRGKGYALDWARQVLAADPPAAIVVLDADCAFTRGSPAVLAQHAASRGCAVQAENVQHAPAGSAAPVRIGAFAFFVMNVVRAAGLERLGGSALLQGTGMALPWPAFAQLSLASGETVEDLAVSLQLAEAGVPVVLDPRVAVASVSPKAAGNLDQRRRWEFGFLRTGMRRGLPLMSRGVLGRNRMLAAIGAHLLVPPLALLTIVAGSALTVCAGAAATGLAPAAPALLLAIAWAASIGAVALAWALRGRAIVSFATLASAPLYVAWKIPMYLGLGRRGGLGWNRAERADPRSGSGDP